MKIAIISDIHENIYNLISFYEQIKNENIEQILCLWDLMNNWIAKVLAFSNIPVHMIWWNNDWDKVAITKTSLSEKSLLTTSSTVFDSLEIDWKRIFLTHYPNLAKSIAKSNDYDIVFYWHNHISSETKIWNCLIVNPWEISSHKTWKSSFAIYDTEDNTIKIIEVKDYINSKNEKVDAYRKKMWFNFSEKEYSL